MSLLADSTPRTTGLPSELVKPDSSRGERATSFDVADFPVPHGREEDWRFTPIDRIQRLLSEALPEADAAAMRTAMRAAYADARTAHLVSILHCAGERQHISRAIKTVSTDMCSLITVRRKKSCAAFSMWKHMSSECIEKQLQARKK